MANLFNKAKKSAPAKAKAKDEKVRLEVSDEGFFQKIEKLEKLNDNMKSDKAKADMISDEIRDIAKREWTNHYSKIGKNPDSVMVFQSNGEDIAQLMFIPTDKYITINEARAEELRQTYNDEIVEEETLFSFDSAMVQKYGEILSNLIEECQEISEDDKEKIIKATTKFNVSKGTIDKMVEYGDVESVMEDIKPVVSLRNIEVIKG